MTNTFFRAGEVEAWGRGIQRIFEACQNAGTPAPIIDYKPHDLWLEFPFAQEYLKALGQEAGAALVSKLDEKLDETTQKTTQKTTQETTQEKIITLLLANPATTRVALAKALGITADGVKYHLDKLRAAGKIRHHGSTKAGHWEVTPE